MIWAMAVSRMKDTTGPAGSGRGSARIAVPLTMPVQIGHADCWSMGVWASGSKGGPGLVCSPPGKQMTCDASVKLASPNVVAREADACHARSALCTSTATMANSAIPVRFRVKRISPQGSKFAEGHCIGNASCFFGARLW